MSAVLLTSPALRAGLGREADQRETRSGEGEGRSARESVLLAPHPALRADLSRAAGEVIVIAAGGTGGHFFPAEALAAELLARGHRIALMTDARSGGLHSAVFAGQPQCVLSGAGIAGRGVVRAVKAVGALAAGTLQARAALQRLGASVVVGFGGYPSVAPVLGARLLRRRPRVVLHEQNAVLGRANRFLARHADALALSFAGTTRVPSAAATVVTGNPVRPAITALADIGYVPPTDRLNLLVLGGSLGARVFSDVVPPALIALPHDLRARLRLVQQCRPEDLERVRAAYTQAGIAAELAAFFPDVAERLTRAHLVIARAGASTVAELAVAGRPSILVPLPGAIDDHQTANARALVDARGAAMIAQRDLTADALRDRVAALLSEPDMLAHAARAAHGMARADATARLADLVEGEMGHGARTPPPLVGGGWGEGSSTTTLRSTPPPNPLPQGEGESVRHAVQEPPA